MAVGKNKREWTKGLLATARRLDLAPVRPLVTRILFPFLIAGLSKGKKGGKKKM